MNAKIILFVVGSLAAAGTALCGQPQPGTLLWTYDAGSTITTSPALAQDGTIYVGRYPVLCAVTNNGVVASNRWAASVSIAGDPAVGADGTIYFSDGNGSLVAVNPSGVQIWTSSDRVGRGAPATGPDGSIYIDGWSYFHAVTASGSSKWKALLGSDNRYCAPAVAPDGTIYVASSGISALYAIEPGGTIKWSFGVRSGVSVPPSPAIGRDGTIYVTLGPLYAFSPDGTNLWTTSSTRFGNSSAVIGKDGSIYVVDEYSKALYSFTPEGEVAWSAAVGAQQDLYATATAPAVDSKGTIYYCVSNSLVALSPTGQVLRSFYGGDSPAPNQPLANTSPAIGPDGTIYAAIGTKLYAIAGTNALGDTPWPMYRQNPRHTGKVEKPALNPPQRRSDANFEFQLYPQQLGLTYTIEASTNLNTWTSLTSFVATTLPTDVVDLTATNFPGRFYRAFSPP